MYCYSVTLQVADNSIKIALRANETHIPILRNTEFIEEFSESFFVYLFFYLGGYSKK